MHLKTKNHKIRGIVRLDKKTKNLCFRLQPGEIAIIEHPDLDEVAAEDLLKCKVKAVINTASFTTGHYPNKGPELLASEEVPLIELPDDRIFPLINDGEVLEIRKGDLYIQGSKVLAGNVLTAEKIAKKIKIANQNISFLLDDFLQNTLEYAMREKDFILGNIKIPALATEIKDRQVLVVVRGRNYREDLKIIRDYIEERRPVLIGVDGGADALLEFGFNADIIIGDMDSVSDLALKKGKEIILHAYLDGRAPGEKKCQNLGIDYKTFPSLGTSEDIALLLAYEKGAELIVALGTHSNMIDFLEKGRAGMASTFLVRLKVGSRLIDARGVSRLYSGKHKGRSVFFLLTAAILPVAIIISFSPLVQHLFRLLILRLRLQF